MKYFLILFSSLKIISAFAQPFEASPANQSINYVSIGEYVTSTIQFVNNADSGLVLQWDLLEKTTPAGWDYSYCDFNTCYDATYVHGVMDTIPAVGNGFIKVNVSTTNESWSYFKFQVSTLNNSEYIDTVEFWFNGINALNEFENDNDLMIFPNPVNSGEVITVIPVEPNSVIQIYNVFGELIWNEKTYQKFHPIKLSNFQPGSYFVRVDNDFHTYFTQLIVR
jgi:hypothetical protein